MIDTVRLEAAIKRKGMKKKFVAEQLGISAYGFSRKLMGRNEFTASEIAVLSDVLGLTRAERDSIFFARRVDGTST